jgi:phosphoribosylformylglycinamidine (FGAM) synthase PurS component
MVRRTVESMKFFEKNAERQGKVFEFKYRNETEQIKDEIIRTN